MKTRNLAYLYALSLFSIIVGCSNDEDSKPNEKETPVKKIEAHINFDLSKRSDWTLSMGGYIYDYEIHDNKLIGTPKDEPFHYAAGMEETNGSTEVILRSSTPQNRLNMPKTPEFVDQSSIEKFIIEDMLVGRYKGKVKEEITNLKLVHYNALLDFKVTNIPENAEIFIKQQDKQTITPLKDENKANSYKAIVWSSNKYEEIKLIIKISEKTYETVLREEVKKSRSLAYHFDGIGNGSIVNFIGRINAEDKLVIEELSIDSWAEEWPINN